MNPPFTKRPVSQSSINNFNALLSSAISTGDCISCKVENYSDITTSVYHCLIGTVSDREFVFKVLKQSTKHFFQLHCHLTNEMSVYVKYDESDFSVPIPTKQTEYGYWVEVPTELICDPRNKFLHSQNSVIVQFHCVRNFAFTQMPFAANGRRTRRDEELFSQDMLKLYDLRDSTGDFSIWVRGKKIPVHKFVFEARTMWFRLNPQSSSSIAVLNCEPHIVEKVIRYMYTGVLEKTDKKGMVKILRIADKFKMLGLVTTLVVTIRTIKAKDNIDDIFRVAEELEIIDLQYYAREFLDKPKNVPKAKKKVLKHGRRWRR